MLDGGTPSKVSARLAMNSFIVNDDNDALDQTWANYGPRAKAGPPVLLFWPAGTYTNLNSHREFSGRSFFPIEIMDGSDFQKISLNGAKLE